MLNIGSNQFQNVAIPLIFEDRYFIIEQINGQDTFTVFSIVNGQQVIEILRNKPNKNILSQVEANATGIITVSDIKSGQFLYKIRPGSNASIIFGKIQGKEEEIGITDKEITYRGGKYLNNVIVGAQVGIKINNDGSVSMGSQFPPELKKFIK